MRRVLRSIVWVCALACANDTIAGDATTLVRLSEGGFGSARDWELRLERDGRVIEERSDIDARHADNIIRKHVVRVVPAADIPGLIATAAAIAAPLPKYIDDDGLIYVDTETRSIRVIAGGVEKFSGWDRYAHKPATADSRRFMASWRALRDLLGYPTTHPRAAPAPARRDRAQKP